MSEIRTLHAREVLDSRGNPTIEVEVWLESGAYRARARAVGRLDGDARGRRAPRRRGEPLPRQGRQARRPERDRGDRARDRGPRGGRAGADRPRAPRAGRHAQQVGTRGERAARRLARRGAGGGGRGGPAAVPVPRRARRADPARAAHERAERRRPRGQWPRHPGVHDRARGGGELQRGAAHGRRDLPHAQEAPEGQGALDGRRRRGRLRARAGQQRGRARLPAARHRARGLPPRRRGVARARRRGQRVPRARTLSASRGPHGEVRGGDDRVLRGAGRPLSHLLDRGRPRRGRPRRAGRA